MLRAVRRERFVVLERGTFRVERFLVVVVVRGVVRVVVEDEPTRRVRGLPTARTGEVSVTVVVVVVVTTPLSQRERGVDSCVRETTCVVSLWRWPERLVVECRLWRAPEEARDVETRTTVL